jgi:predicted aminopeptidase
LIALFSLSLLATGCSSIHFLYQAGRGQLSLLNRARPLNEVTDDPRTDPKLAELLKQIPLIKKFGEKYGLKPTPNYNAYVKLNQDAVVYVVTVSEPLEFKAKIFSFPIVGSFNYIGWFGRKDAEDFASTFVSAGDDVDVRGASAYSTLGWFKDPLLSSMIPSHDGSPTTEALPELVNVVLHESVHATLYINDQSYFNESLAFYLADVLTEKYFRENGLLDSAIWKAYLKNRNYYEKLQERMAVAYQDLKKIYDSKASDEEKQKQKAAYLSSLQSELKFKRPISNATLIQFQTYDPGDHGFGELFKKYNEDVREFLQALQKLKPSEFEHPHQIELKGLLEKL